MFINDTKIVVILSVEIILFGIVILLQITERNKLKDIRKTAQEFNYGEQLKLESL